MPDTDVFSKASDIVSLIVSFMYKLTVQLAVEFLKFIILLGILIASCGVFGLGFVSLVAWAYVAFDSSLVAAAGAACLGIVMFIVSAVAVQFLVKDVLCLTDKSLLHLAKIYVVSLTGRGRRGGNHDVTTRPPEAEGQKVKKAV